MESTSFIDDAVFYLPPEFLSDDDFLLEKENKVGAGFGSTGKPIGDEENFSTGLTRQMLQSTLEHDFAGGCRGGHAFPAGSHNKALCTSRSPLCGAGIGCDCRNQRSNENRQSRVSSQAKAWDLYCAAAVEMARMNINDEPYSYNNHSGRGLVDLPRKHPLAAAKNPNNGSGYNIHQSLRYQNLQAIQFQQLKQQQLMKHHRQLVQQGRVNNNNKSVAHPVDLLSSSAWSNQPPRRDGSGMRAVFLGKRGSTGTGVFLPRRVNHTSPATTEKPTVATVLVPARVAQVLNLNESVVQPVVRSSASLKADASWRQRSSNGIFSSQMKMEQAVNEPRLPSDWAY